jgi:hypothetical protein
MWRRLRAPVVGVCGHQSSGSLHSGYGGHRLAGVICGACLLTLNIASLSASSYLQSMAELGIIPHLRRGGLGVRAHIIGCIATDEVSKLQWESACPPGPGDHLGTPCMHMGHPEHAVRLWCTARSRTAFEAHTTKRSNAVGICNTWRGEMVHRPAPSRMSALFLAAGP